LSDIERHRFPDIQHRGLIVADEITHRFFNIVSLLNRAVPIHCDPAERR
jgi:hypothetical protein